jgi:hypothetical protein
MKDFKSKIRKLVSEIITTDFSNDGWGGIASQTGDDLMGYNHSESGPLHQGKQPGDYGGKHIYFTSGDGGQSEEQSDAAGKSSGENIEENSETEGDGYNFMDLLKYIKKYQLISKKANLTNSIHTQLLNVGSKLGEGEYKNFEIKIKSGKFKDKEVYLNLKGKASNFYGNVDFNFSVEVFLGDKLEKVVEKGSSVLEHIFKRYSPTRSEVTRYRIFNR